MRKRLAGIVTAAMAAVVLSFGMSVGAATAFSAAPSHSFTNVYYDM